MRFYDTGLNVKYLQDFRGSYKPKTTYCCFNNDPSEFSLVRDFALYIFFLLDVVSIFRVQFRGPIRSCNNNITMTTHSLNVGRKLCGSRRLCVSMATARVDRFVNGIFAEQMKIMACFKPDKKRKVDSKNLEFKTEWTDKYAFVLPVGSTKPMCSICNETVALVKSGNAKRHYETKHAHLEQKYPQNSEVRGRKINHLQSYQATCSVIVRSATQQERAYLNILL